MSETKHTPGPWEIYEMCGPLDYGHIDCGGGGRLFARQTCEPRLNHPGPCYKEIPQNIADARLIAAAPDLLAAAGLRDFLAEALIIADTEGMSDDTELPVWPNNNAKKHSPLTVGALRALGAAIAKAGGRS